MIRVLIAEDELPILRGIKNMIEKIDTEFHVVKCASNGRDAIDFLADEQIDVLFTDMNMPLADGIALLSFVSKKYPQCLKVVISGYGEFEYAQQAIRLGVKEYLLKPIVYEELAGILHNLRASIEASREEKQKSLLTSAVYQEAKGSEMERVQIAYLCAGPMIKEGFEESIEECNFWKDMDLDLTALKYLPEKSTVYTFEKYQANEKILLLVDAEAVSIQKTCERLVEEAQKKDIYVTAVWHKASIDLQAIPSISRKLRQAMKSAILFGQSSVLEDVEALKKCGRHSPPVCPKLYSENKNTLLKEVELVLSHEILRQEALVHFLEELLQQVFPRETQYWEENEDTVWNLLLYSPDKKALYKNLAQILLEKGLGEQQESAQQFMERVERYVQKHLTEGITVASIAAQFGLVPPYLSRLFKEYSGFSLLQYVQKIRIERAKGLLEMDGAVSVKEVAELVGYPNPLYFSKMFKKKVGLYPSEYRKRKQEKVSLNLMKR